MPLKSGFSADTAYRALGLFNPSETSDAYFVLSNDRDEVWFICNRYLRTVGLLGAQACTAMHLPLAVLQDRMQALPRPLGLKVTH